MNQSPSLNGVNHNEPPPQNTSSDAQDASVERGVQSGNNKKVSAGFQMRNQVPAVFSSLANKK